jgi:Fe-S-cluster containining protein
MLDFSQFLGGRWQSNPCPSLQDGLCRDYADRPKACEGSPFFDYGEEAFKVYGPYRFPVPWCSFRKHVLQYYGIPFEILETADDCIKAYSAEGLADFERFAIKWFKHRTVFWE